MPRIDIAGAQRARSEALGEPTVAVMLHPDGGEVELVLVPEVTLAVAEVAAAATTGTITVDGVFDALRALLADPGQLDDPRVLAAVKRLTPGDVAQLVDGAFGGSMGESEGSSSS